MVKDRAIKLSLAVLFASAGILSALAFSVQANAAEQKKVIKVSPILECIVPTGENTYKVFWGYENKSTLDNEPYVVPANEVEQKFTGGTATLPAEFGYPNVVDGRPGRTAFDQAEPNAFTTMLTAGEKQVWTLNGKTSTASKDSKWCPAYFQFDKVWEGDSFDASNVVVKFTANAGDSEFSWTLGVDAPVKVQPGESTLTEVQEVITGLPESCSYESDVPSEITAPEMGYDENGLYTLTVTNTVNCEEEDEEPQVLAVATPQVTQTPTGSANAGGAGQIALIGFAASFAVAAFGVLARKFSRN